MQGVIKSFDPESKLGSLISDNGKNEIDLSENALDGSIFLFLRQGQRVNFDLNEDGQATNVRMGSEVDMQTKY